MLRPHANVCLHGYLCRNRAGVPGWNGVRIGAVLLASLPLLPLAAAAPSYADAQPILATHCYECHGKTQRKAGVDLQRFADAEAAGRELRLWRKVGEMLAHGEMPPQGSPEMPPAQRQTVRDWIANLQPSGPPDPGRVTIRRLNRDEYRNTIRDLLGLEATPADAFPSDEIGYGFDNIGEVLSLSPLLMEKYLTAASELLDQAIIYEQLKVRVPASDLDAAADDGTPLTPTLEKEAVVLTTSSQVSVELRFPVAGTYTVDVRAGAFQVGQEPVTMQVLLDKRTLEEVPLTTRSTAGGTHRVTVRDSKPGTYRLAVRFVNPGSVTHEGKEHHRALHVREVRVTGPRAAQVPMSHKRIMIAKPSEKLEPVAAARQIITNFASRAFRRPVVDSEVDRLMRLFTLADEKGLAFEDGIRLALQAVLVSPHFLYRIEQDPPGDAKGGAGQQVQMRALGPYELASRLSYFLWNSMPDDALFALAASGDLVKPEVLLAQTKRMLADRKAEDFVASFASQWLQLRELDRIEPDPQLYPGITPRLKEAMAAEACALVGHVLRQDRPITELIDGDYVFVNALLAQHYGLPPVTGLKLQQVPVTDGRRGGVLGLGGVLLATSTPTRTNPPRRGKFLLEQLLGDPPPPPPPNVDTLPDDKNRRQGMTLREALEQHRTKPDCMACHLRLDPLGFGLENYDAVGRWRSADNGKTVDSSGTLPSGETFKDPRALRRLLISVRQEQFARTFTGKLLTYALGRGLEESDEPVLTAIGAELTTRGMRSSAIIEGIVISLPFRYSRR